MASEKKKLSLKEKYPELYAQKDVDRRGYKRVVPMEILSLSLGRTGTMCEWFFRCSIQNEEDCVGQNFIPISLDTEGSSMQDGFDVSMIVQ